MQNIKKSQQTSSGSELNSVRKIMTSKKVTNNKCMIHNPYEKSNLFSLKNNNNKKKVKNFCLKFCLALLGLNFLQSDLKDWIS